jgi:glycosyltransferase involved in cell wall biosynthesis
MKTPLLYALHSGNLYGTERMALATAEGLVDEFEPVIFAPSGEALKEAGRLGFEAVAFTGARDFAFKLRPYLARSSRAAFVATGVTHSLACIAWNSLYRRSLVHLHVVHGGTDEKLSYGRKRRLNPASVTFVAVSNFVRDRLVAHGVREKRIEVVENFLSQARVDAFPKRKSFNGEGVRKALVVSRVDPIKRLDVLLDALEGREELGKIQVRVLGTGWELETMRERAAARLPNVTFAGFSGHVAEEMRDADLLVHTCPEEPFGLAILEAMAVGIPVVVSDSGGAGSLVEEGRSGFRFRANDPGSLASCLSRVQHASADVLNKVVEGGRKALSTRFSASVRSEDYRKLLKGAAA